MNFSVIACYAALKANISNNIDDAFCRMLQALIVKKQYPKIDVPTLVIDFKDEFGFELPYFPMIRILNILVKSSAIRKRKDGTYYVNKINQADAENFWNSIAEQERCHQKLISEFVQYYNTTYSDKTDFQEAESLINSFVEENGLLFIQNHDVAERVTSAQVYKICSFLYNIQHTQPDLYAFVDSTILGRILSELIAFSDNRTDTIKSAANVYLDTNVVFSLLGINSFDRSQYYESLLKDMVKLGMHIHIYHHTYDEIITILDNSLYWIGNYNYDPSKASETTYYFISNGWTKDQVESFIASLDTKLKQFNIFIDDYEPYPQNTLMHINSDRDYYNQIVQYYKGTNSSFVEADMKETIEYDARSFFFTEYHNNGEIPKSFIDISNIFVTANRSLSHLAKNISYQKTMVSFGSIPFCVSDLFWGNLVWANSPASLNMSSRERLNSIVNAAFEPSAAMLEKLKNALHKLVEDEKITPEICYFLKSSRLAQKLLMQITEGDDNNFTDMTPLDILKEIQDEAKSKGIAEEKERSDAVKRDFLESNIHRQIQHDKDMIEQLESIENEYNSRISTTNTLLERIHNDYTQLKGNQIEAEQKTNFWVKVIQYGIGSLFLIYAIGGCFFSLISGGRFFNLYTFIIGALALMLLTIIPTWFLTKSFVIKDSQKLREAIYGFYENKLNCSHKTEDSISAEMSRLTDCIEELNRCIEENRNKIKFYKNEIQELENRLKSLA